MAKIMVVDDAAFMRMMVKMLWLREGTPTSVRRLTAQRQYRCTPNRNHNWY